LRKDLVHLDVIWFPTIIQYLAVFSSKLKTYFNTLVLAKTAIPPHFNPELREFIGKLKRLNIIIIDAKQP
jgi:hypothetical protein